MHPRPPELTLAFLPSPSAPSAPSLTHRVHRSSICPCAPGLIQPNGSRSQNPCSSAQNAYRGRPAFTTSARTGVDDGTFAFPEAAKEVDNCEMAGGAEGRRSRSSPWKAGGRGAALALMSESMLPPAGAGRRSGFDRRVEVPLPLMYWENASLIVSPTSYRRDDAGCGTKEETKAYRVCAEVRLFILSAYCSQLEALCSNENRGFACAGELQLIGTGDCESSPRKTRLSMTSPPLFMIVSFTCSGKGFLPIVK